MKDPVEAMKTATANWQAVRDATKAESEKIKAEREGEATSETAK